MKTYQYLKSGILEAYLLGSTTEEEKEEVEKLLATDADVLAELNELEAGLEEYLLQNAVPPPPGVREAIALRLSETEITKWKEPAYSEPDPEPNQSRSRESSYVDVEVDNTHIRVHKNWRPAFIAVFILSKIFLILGLYYYFKSASQEQEIMRLKAQFPQTAPLSRPVTP
ncbi:hypothetical protein [Spirosoma aerophilum]